MCFVSGHSPDIPKVKKNFCVNISPKSPGRAKMSILKNAPDLTSTSRLELVEIIINQRENSKIMLLMFSTGKTAKH